MLTEDLCSIPCPGERGIFALKRDKLSDIIILFRGLRCINDSELKKNRPFL